MLDLAHRRIIRSQHAERYPRKVDPADNRTVGQGVGAAGQGQAVAQVISPSGTTQAIPGHSPVRKGDLQ